MKSFIIQLNSIREPGSNSFEHWSIPAEFSKFRQQALEAFEAASGGKSKLWGMSNDALDKAGENWEYFIPHFREFWVRTFLDNMRSQIWCETYDQIRSGVPENVAREEAMRAAVRLSQNFTQA